METNYVLDHFSHPQSCLSSNPLQVSRFYLFIKKLEKERKAMGAPGVYVGGLFELINVRTQFFEDDVAYFYSSIC
jgi:hypothetical protein